MDQIENCATNQHKEPTRVVNRQLQSETSGSNILHRSLMIRPGKCFLRHFLLFEYLRMILLIGEHLCGILKPFSRVRFSLGNKKQPVGEDGGRY